jgi:hypothetical protein
MVILSNFIQQKWEHSRVEIEMGYKMLHAVPA